VNEELVFYLFFAVPLGAIVLFTLSFLVVSGLRAPKAAPEPSKAQDWEAAARRLGLTCQTPTRAAGELQGQAVEVCIATVGISNHRSQVTQVSVDTGGRLPSALRISPVEQGLPFADLGLRTMKTGDPAIDVACAISADDGFNARLVLQDPLVRRRLRGLSGRLRLRGGIFEVRFSRISAVGLGERVWKAIDMAQALLDSVERPMSELAKLHGLTKRVLPGGLALEGRLRDLEVIIESGSPEGRDLRTLIQVARPEGVPPDLGVVLKEEGLGLELGDPILDPLLSVTCSDEDAARTLLMDDELRGCLLAVVHGHPGSRVEEGAVLLEVPGLAGPETDELLVEALALGAALAGRVA